MLRQSWHQQSGLSLLRYFGHRVEERPGQRCRGGPDSSLHEFRAGGSRRERTDRAGRDYRACGRPTHSARSDHDAEHRVLPLSSEFQVGEGVI